MLYVTLLDQIHPGIYSSQVIDVCDFLNDKYKAKLEKAGMQITGINPDTGLTEIVEIPEHPYFVGVQFHPELKSTVDNPHPLFTRFIRAAMDKQKDKNL